MKHINKIILGIIGLSLIPLFTYAVTFSVGITSTSTSQGWASLNPTISNAGTVQNTFLANTYIATSSTASSTFANGLNLTKGCFSQNGTCIGGTGSVSSVSNSDSSLTISPTSGNVIASLNLAHANTFTANQTVPCLLTGGTGSGVQPILGGDSNNDFATTHPCAGQQLGIDSSQAFPALYYSYDGITGHWNQAFFFPSGVAGFGVDPNTLTTGRGGWSGNTSIFNFNSSPSTAKAPGDSGIVSINWSGSSLNSGSSLCAEQVALIGDRNHNGTTTDVGQENSNCFLAPPNYSILSDTAANSAIIINYSPQYTNGLALGASPDIGSANGLSDSYNMVPLYVDSGNGGPTSVRIPRFTPDVGTPYQKVYQLTVSGVTTINQGEQFNVNGFNGAGGTNYLYEGINTISGGAGTINVTGTTTPPSSGTLTLDSQTGNGDATVSFTGGGAGSLFAVWRDAFSVNNKTGLVMASTTYTTTSTSTQMYVTNLVSGNCVQASTNGLLTTTGSACGSGGGGGTPGDASSTIQFNGTGAFHGITNFTTDGTNPIITSETGSSSGALYFGTVKAIYGSVAKSNGYIFGAGTLGTSTVSTGTGNFAMGVGALGKISEGIQNTAVGGQALANDASSSNNTAVGSQALSNFNDRTGNGNNSAVGFAACIGTSTTVLFKGDSDNCFGASSGILMRSASFSNLFGKASGPILRDGQRDQMFGTGAGVNLRDGSDNVFIGDSAGFTSTALQDSNFAGAIGSNAVVGCANCFVIGGPGTSHMNLGDGTTTPTFALSIEGTSTLGNAAIAGYYISTTTATSTFAGGISASCFTSDNVTCLNNTYASASAYKQASRYATTAALPANTYVNGTGGVGATLTEVGTGALSVDGASPSIGDRILVKNEVAGANNGIYTVTATGSGIAAYVLTRATDFNTSADVFPGVATYVSAGTVNIDDVWALSNTSAVTIGTTALTFAEISATPLITSVSNSDSTLTISPTTGAVVGSLNLAHANTWSALQQFSNSTSTLLSATYASTTALLVAGTNVVGTFDKATWIGSTTIDAIGNSYSVATSSWVLWNPSRAATMTNYYCTTDTGTAVMQFGTGVASTTSALCTSAGANIVTSSNNAWSARADVRMAIGNQSASNKVTVTATFFYP